MASVRRLEERTLGVARLASTAQQYAEQQGAAQGAAQAELARRLRGVEARLDELERLGRAAEWEERLRSGVAIDSFFRNAFGQANVGQPHGSSVEQGAPRL